MCTSIYRYICFRVIALLLLVIGMVGEGYGQDKVRTYANFQGAYEKGTGALGLPVLVGSIDNANDAVNKNPRDFSRLNVPIGALNLVETTQFLEFTINGQHSDVRTILAGIPVTIKLTMPKELLGLLSAIKIGTFTNLISVNASWPLLPGLGEGHKKGYNSTSKIQYLSDGSLLNLLNGAGELEITFTPTSTYNGVYMSLESILGLGLSADLFHAYILEEGTSPCDDKDKAIDVLSGVRAGTVVGGVANATGSVIDPWNIMDADESTYAEINTGAQLLSEVFHTTIFQTASKPKQVAKVVLQGAIVGLGGVLDLNLLMGLVIQPYLGTAPVGVPIDQAATILSLRLVPGSTDKYELAVPVEGSFDRIEIKMGGVVGALESLRIYEVSRLPALPILKDEDEVVIEKNFQVCEGEKATLTASAPIGSTLNWYTSQDGGSSFDTGDSITVGNLSESTTYYVSAVPKGCTVESIRLPIHVKVFPKPGAPHLTISNIND